MLRSLWLGRNLLQSTDDTRLHHQLAPMNIFYETGLSQVSISVVIKTRISFKLFPGYYRRLSIQGSHAQHDNICCSSEFHYKRKRWKNLCRRWLQRNGRYWWILRRSLKTNVRILLALSLKYIVSKQSVSPKLVVKKQQILLLADSSFSQAWISSL